MKGKKTGGRIAYTGVCVLCGTAKSPRWYKTCIKEGTICRSCYQKERLKDDNIRATRLKQRRHWSKKNPYRAAENQARSKKMEFSLTEQQYLEKTKECFYCGYDLSNIGDGMRLDRIDSSKFYTQENTVGCCRMCNIAKNNHTIEEFYAWIARLKTRLK